MPSKGTPRYTFRIPQELMDAIDGCIKSRNKHKADDRPWDRTDWMIAAITEKLSKTLRDRRQSKHVKAYKTEENEPREVFGYADELVSRELDIERHSDGTGSEIS